MTTVAAGQVNFQRVLLGGWRAFVPIVLGNAAVQALLIIGDPVPRASLAFGVLVAASAFTAVAAVWLVSCVAATAACGRPVRGWSSIQKRPAALASSAILAVLAAGGGVWNPLTTPVILLSGIFVLTAAAHGSPHPVRAGFHPASTRPGAYLMAVVGFTIMMVVNWAVALLAGFLITGVAGSFLTWTWIGMWTVLILALWSWMYGGAKAGRQGESVQ